MITAADIVGASWPRRKESYCKEMGKYDTSTQFSAIRKPNTPIKESPIYPNKSDSLVQNISAWFEHGCDRIFMVLVWGFFFFVVSLAFFKFQGQVQ